MLEDLGWYVVDNLPTSLVDTIVDLASKPGSGIDRLALVSGRQHVDAAAAGRRAAGRRPPCAHRCSSTPDPRAGPALRRARAASTRCAEADGLVEAIELERASLDPVQGARRSRDRHHRPQRPPAEGKLIAAFDQTGDGQRLQIAVESFGYKHGLPLDADIVMDVRFLPEPALGRSAAAADRPRPAVRDYVLERAAGVVVPRPFEAMLLDLLPRVPGRRARAT